MLLIALKGETHLLSWTHNVTWIQTRLTAISYFNSHHLLGSIKITLRYHGCTCQLFTYARVCQCMCVVCHCVRALAWIIVHLGSRCASCLHGDGINLAVWWMERRHSSGENLLHQLCRGANDSKENRLVLAFYCGGFLRKWSEWDSMRKRTSGCLLPWVSPSVTPSKAVPCRYSWSLSRLNGRIICFFKRASVSLSPQGKETFNFFFNWYRKDDVAKKSNLLSWKWKLYCLIAQAAHVVSSQTMDCLLCPFYVITLLLNFFDTFFNYSIVCYITILQRCLSWRTWKQAFEVD